MSESKKDQLFKLLCEAGASKDEITTMLQRYDDRNGTGSNTVCGSGSTTTGAMTDASKRRHMADDEGFSLVGSTESSPVSTVSVTKAMTYGYNAEDFMAKFGAGSYAPPVSMAAMGVPYKIGEYKVNEGPWQGDQSIPLPKGVDSLEQWGRVVCKMEGHRDIQVKGKTFGMLLAESHSDQKMKKYLAFICKKFKNSISDQPESQGPDLAAFCLRCHFNPEEDCGKKGYIREFGS